MAATVPTTTRRRDWLTLPIVSGGGGRRRTSWSRTVKYLIVNADDFGHSGGVNAGVIEAHEHGILTSASLMVRRGEAGTAAAYARKHPNLSVGLHVDLGEWVRADGAWEALYEVDGADVASEVSRQLDIFCNLIGRSPTHLDSHQHVHRREPARTAVLALARDLRVPLRHFDLGVRYCGGFYGQTDAGGVLRGQITIDALLEVFRSLPDGITELACHPGKGEIPGTSYSVERERELETLCDARARMALEAHGILLRSFANINIV
jgi:chitin disaccharide deacetylase